MSLQSEYSASVDPIFVNNVRAALVHAATTILTAGNVADATAQRAIRLAIRVFKEPVPAAQYMAAGLAASGLNAGTADSTLQTAVTNAFPTLAWLYDAQYGT